MPVSCPNRAELDSFQAGGLDETVLATIASHVETCHKCQKQLETIVGDSADTVLQALLSEPAPGPFAGEATCRSAVERVAALGKSFSVKSAAGTESPTVDFEGREEIAAGDPLPHESIREYQLLAKLGEGGMGAVYKALHTRLDKVVALKVLPPGRMKDSGSVARFQREMKAVGRLDHPNIVRAMDAGEEDGTHFLVMEYVEGADLSQLAKNIGPLPVADACELVRQAALGLQEAHEHGMVHRDIKPSNLILARSARKKSPPTLKILDLGLALLGEALSADQGLTSTGQMMGTIDYMAPEQGGDSHQVDIRADIYSLGATLYKLLTGSAPFAGEKLDAPVKKLLALATQEPPPVQSRRADLPPPLAKIVHKMMAKEPAKRYATPDELAEALAPFCQGANLSALLERGTRPSQPNSSSSEAPTHPQLSSGTADTAPTIDRSIKAETKSPSRSALAGFGRKIPRSVAIATACGGAALALLLGVIFYLQISKETTIRIEIIDPAIKVVLDENSATFEGVDKQHKIKVEPGEHGLTITRGDFKFVTDKFELRKRETLRLSVTYLAGEVRVERADGTPLKVVSATPPAPPPPSPTGFALQFDGQTSYVEFPTFQPDFSQPFTFEAVVEPHPEPRQAQGGDDWAGVGKVFSFAGEKARYWMVFNHVSGGWIVRYRTPQSDLLTSSQREKLHGVRHHIAAVWTGKKFSWFVDGKESSGRAEAKPSDDIGIPGVASIGGNPYAAASRYFRGLLDEVRISRGVKYERDFIPTSRLEPDADTLALYHFDEGQGDDLKDSSGNNHHGKILGAKWVKADGTPLPPTGFALQLDGQTSYIEFPTFRPDFSQPFTLEAVVEPHREPRPPVKGGFWPSVGKVFSCIDEDKFNYWMVFNHVSGGWIVRYRTGQRDHTTYSRPMALHGVRHHIAVVWTGKKFDWFINGQLANGRVKEESPESIGISRVANIGREFSSATGKGGNYFHGTLDEMRISRGVKYTRDYIPVSRLEPDADTLALYHFDEGQGDELKDSSGNNHHGKIVDAKWVREDGTAIKPVAGWHGWPADAPKPAIAPFYEKRARKHQEDWATYLGVQVESENSIGMKLRLVPPGEFMMGSTEAQVEAALKLADELKTDPGVMDRIREAERPQHRVVITRPILMSATEVTVGQFKRFSATGYQTEAEKARIAAQTAPPMQSQPPPSGPMAIQTYLNPGYPVTDDSPVAQVTWNDAVAYCKWLSDEEGATYRLPTEAEWEYACRAGTTTEYSFGDDVALLEQYTWCDKNADRQAHPVGLKLPNAFGLHDMHGNLTEWCQDFFDAGWYAKSSPDDPSGPVNGSGRVLRGGYWGRIHFNNRSAYRGEKGPSVHQSHFGFRVVRTLAVPPTNPKSNIENPKPPAPTDYALEFNGKDSCVELPTLRYDGSHPITIEATIVMHPSTTRGGVVQTKGISLNFPAGDEFKPEYGRFGISDATKYRHIFTRKPLTVNTRMHIAGVFEYPRFRLYLNGVLQDSSELLGQYTDGRSPLFIGAAPATDGTQTGHFRGVVDNVRISRIARYDGDYTPKARLEADADTLALYHFDEGQGNELKDSSGHNHHGKIVGAKWVKGESTAPTRYALEFDGNPDLRVEVPSVRLRRGGPLTLEAYFTPTVDRITFVNQLLGFGSNSLNIKLETQDWHFVWQHGDRTTTLCQAAPFIKGRRIHVAGVVAEGKSRLFVDGKGTTAMPLKFDGQTGQEELSGLFIGSAFQGLIDNVRISQTARYREDFVPADRLRSDSDTLAYFDFAEGTGAELKDSSGHNHHGKIVGAKWVKEVSTPGEVGWHSWPKDAPAPAIAPFDAKQARKHQEEWAAYLGVPVEYENSFRMKFVLIPPGEFTMGSTEADIEAALKVPNSNEWAKDYIRGESPRHRVILTQPIYLGIHEVTQKQFELVTGENPSHFSPKGAGKNDFGGMDRTNCPVENIRWIDAAEFCIKLSQREKLKPFYLPSGETVAPAEGTAYRLPTESQWEFACRAGTTTKYWTGDKDEDLLQAAWFGPNAKGLPQPVGMLRPNPLGLYDVHGNIWEWVHDWWEPGYYGQFKEQPRGEPQRSRFPWDRANAPRRQLDLHRV